MMYQKTNNCISTIYNYRFRPISVSSNLSTLLIKCICSVVIDGSHHYYLVRVY